MDVDVSALSPHSRVWVYQSSRPFTEEEIASLNLELASFTYQWTAHNQQLAARGGVAYGRFVLLMVDETRGGGASGCSIDKSVHFVQALGEKYQVDFFDRMSFAYWEGEEVKVAPRAEFAQLYADGQLTDETLVFDNLVDSVEALSNRWQLPLGQSWHKRMVR